MSYKKPTGFHFTAREFIGSLGDLGTLLPLMVGLVAFNGLDAGRALALVGITYILTGVYYRLPVPVQPLKAAAMIAIATGASVGEIRAAALWMAGVMLILAATRLVDKLNEIFPQLLVRGLQLGLGLMMIRTGVKFITSYPDMLSSVVHGVHAASVQGGLLPSGSEFWSALLFLVLPQLPLTVGNAVLATRDCALSYFGGSGSRVTAGRLAATIGLGNLAAGVAGGMPMCHGAGGMTAHYHMGARTGAAGVMLGTLFLAGGIIGGHQAGALLASVPAWVLGVSLMYVGVRHGMFAREAFGKPATAATTLGMGVAGYFTGNLLAALGTGLALKTLLLDLPGWLRRGITTERAGAEADS